MGKPAYVDTPVPEPHLRRRHNVTSRHEPRFTRAYMRLSRNLIDDTTKQALLRMMRKAEAGEATIEEVVDQVDWFNPADPLASKLWTMLGTGLERVFTDTVDDAGDGETRAHGWPIRFQVKKARELLVPINPFSLAFVQERSARLVAEISDQQKTLLRQIIADGFSEGERPGNILKEIEKIVGLLERERTAVLNREDTMFDAGMPADVIDKAGQRYAEQLLRKRAQRIARTETIDAYSQGLQDSWQLAKQEGFIEPEAQKEWVELTNSPRTCKICQGLGGQRVPLDQPFVSDIIGEVDRPPSHPHCRCTTFLVAGDDLSDDAARRADKEVQIARDTLAGG